MIRADLPSLSALTLTPEQAAMLMLLERMDRLEQSFREDQLRRLMVEAALRDQIAALQTELIGRGAK
jgi:hypothetical protein